MRMTGRWMVVKFDRPMETKLASGVISPAVDAHKDKPEKTERMKDEWWPEIGTVLFPPHSHMSMRPSKETVMTEDGREVVKLENYQTGWRVPKRGDRVVFGFKDVNINTLEKGGMVIRDGKNAVYIILDVAKAAYVIPRDGSCPYALGEWVVLEQIPKTIYSGKFVATFTQEHEHGMGVVRMAGDGFLERHPSVRQGNVVKYMSVSVKNPECPNYVGGYMMSRVKSSLVTAIDHSGMDEAELERLKSEAKELEMMSGALKGSVRSFGSGTAIPIRKGMSELEKAEIRDHNSRIHKERSAESRHLAEIAAAKQQGNKRLGSNRKYY